jgi:hypothetical protein
MITLMDAAQQTINGGKPNKTKTGKALIKSSHFGVTLDLHTCH